MKRKDLMLLLVPSFIMVAAWVIFNIYHSAVSSTISENLNMQINPINPTFDMKEVSAIKKRVSVTPNYQFQKVQGSPEPIVSSQSGILNNVLTSTPEASSSSGTTTP